MNTLSRIALMGCLVVVVGLLSPARVSAETKTDKSQFITHAEVSKMLVEKLGGPVSGDPAENFAWLVNRNITPMFAWGYDQKPGPGTKPDPGTLVSQADLALLLVKSMGLEGSMDPNKEPAVAALEVLSNKGISLEPGAESAMKNVNPLPGGANINDESSSSDPSKLTSNSRPTDSFADGTDGSLPMPVGRNEEVTPPPRTPATTPARRDTVRRTITPPKPDTPPVS